MDAVARVEHRDRLAPAALTKICSDLGGSRGCGGALLGSGRVDVAYRVYIDKVVPAAGNVLVLRSKEGVLIRFVFRRPPGIGAVGTHRIECVIDVRALSLDPVRSPRCKVEIVREQPGRGALPHALLVGIQAPNLNQVAVVVEATEEGVDAVDLLLFGHWMIPFLL